MSGAGSREREAGSQELGVGSGKPRSRSLERGAGSREPRSGSRYLGAGSGEPRVRSWEWGAGRREREPGVRSRERGAVAAAELSACPCTYTASYCRCLATCSRRVMDERRQRRPGLGLSRVVAGCTGHAAGCVDGSGWTQGGAPGDICENADLTQARPRDGEPDRTTGLNRKELN